METTEVIIARLVLGYLKEEKCRTAYREFLKTSGHFQNDNLTSTKYLPTRFTGLSLKDIIKEYFDISRIVQGRLEATNFYNERGRQIRTSLEHQLQYLLNTKVPSSRTSTPCPRSPADSNLNGTSPSHADHPSDVETTPAHTLPGYIPCSSEDPYLYKTPRRKSTSKLSKSVTAPSLHISAEDSQMLTDTLLENKELHEKIAETINKVAEKQSGRVPSKLNRTIKTVVKETEADPIFNKILEELMGCSATVENQEIAESSSTASSTAKDTGDDFRNLMRTQIQPTPIPTDDDVNESFVYSNSNRVEQQNEDAIRSIIAQSNLQAQPQPQPPVDQNVPPNNEITVFNGSLDKYLTSNTCNVNTQTQPLQNSLYVNTSGNLLMVPSAVSSNTTVQVDRTQQYYLVNKQSTVSNWDVPMIQATNVLTEQDILAMPTVIVNDERQNKVVATQQLVPNPVLTKKQAPLIPKPIIGIPAEYFYSTNDVQQQSGLKKVVYPKTKKMSKKIESTASSKDESEKNQPTTVNVPKSLPGDLLKTEEKPSDKVTAAAPVNSKVQHEESTPLKECVLQKTPKSGSHVRNLDFSSPPKITSTHRKPLKNRKEGKKLLENKKSPESKKPSVVHKKEAAKPLNSASSSTSEKDVETFPSSKNRKTWDTDLRAVIVPGEDRKPVKRKTPVRKGKKMVKKKSKEQLNTTEDDGARIEAALQTPIKNSDQVDGDGKIENSSITKKVSEFNSNKTVLSPSKLNASKRKLINYCPTENITKSKEEEVINKFITPEMSKQNFHYPIKANRNITSMFETPLKDDVLPKTPGLPSPNTSMTTPFTKMLQANLKGIDINSLATPNVPVTPNFPPFTPNIDLTSPYSNRATDYSTTSSYYQPSDSEPNRSLEANIVELEKQPVATLSDIVIAEENFVKDKRCKNEPVQTINSTVDVRLKIFNSCVIGKKNLNLVKRTMESDSSYSSSSSDASVEDSNEEADAWTEKSNETVISNKKPTETPKRMYSLRNRNTATDKKEDAAKTEVKESPKTTAKEGTKSKMKQINNLAPDIENCEKSKKTVVKPNKNKETKVISKSKKINQEVTPEQVDFKKQLNEKLLRTVNKIKSTEEPTERKTADKTKKVANAKFMKIKIVPNSTKNKRKPKSDKNVKKSPKKQTTTKYESLDTAKVQNKRPRSRSNSNDANKKDPLTLLGKDKTDKSASDVEAQNLIEGLKERGIHLMKNKTSPCKKINESCNISELDKTPNNEKSNRSNPLEISTSELETKTRETYDTRTYEGEHERLTFSETKCIRTFESYDIGVLNKTFIGKVFIEEIDKEIDIPLVVSPFYTLLEIPPTVNVSQKENVADETIKENDKVSKDLPVNVVIAKKTEPDSLNPISKDNHIIRTPTASSKEDRDLLEAPSIKRRKIEKEDTRVPEEKDCKILLQQINVETFLNNIYGNNQ